MADILSLFFGGVAVIISGFTFWRSFRWLSWWFRIRSTKRTMARNVTRGIVELHGKAASTHDPVTAPFSQQPAIYCEARVEEMRNNGKNTSWYAIHKNIESVPLRLEDESGSVLVNLGDIQADIPGKTVLQSSFMKEPPEHVNQYLAKSGLHGKNFVGVNRTLRYVERAIKPGDDLFAIGFAVRSDDGGWMVTKTENEPFLYVGKGTEQKVLSRLGWRGFGLLALGILLLGIGVVLLAVNLPLLQVLPTMVNGSV